MAKLLSVVFFGAALIFFGAALDLCLMGIAFELPVPGPEWDWMQWCSRAGFAFSALALITQYASKP